MILAKVHKNSILIEYMFLCLTQAEFGWCSMTGIFSQLRISKFKTGYSNLCLFTLNNNTNQRCFLFNS